MAMTDLEIANLVLQKAVAKMANDLSKLIGEEIECTAGEGRTISPEEFSAQFKGKLVLCNFVTDGDYAGDSFLVAGAKPAILLGGKLIMLPASELESRVKADNFDGELADAFEEISNIITGALNAEFLNGIPKKLHFKKTSIELVSAPFIPTGIIPGLGEGLYHLTSAAIEAGGANLGTFWFLLPLAALNLDKVEEAEEIAAVDQESAAAGFPPEPGGESSSRVVLIVADEPEERERIASLIAGTGLEVLQAGVQEDLRSVLNGRETSVVLLVMREVGEQSFAAAIKLRSVIKPATPLIAAGPAWTKKAVLQAVKYGACDILITPVAPEDLFEKLRAYKVAQP
ncbi:MAG: response regulator [Desulfobulbaceae bacterium]|nr:response regulator [Desulfobulbaceae bacterium]